MGDLTPRIALYKPGGGSTGTITPDETADIDKLNDNADILDEIAGIPIVTSSTRPADPYDGMGIFESDTGLIRIWRQSITTWVLPNQTSTVSDLDALAALSASDFEGRRIHVDALNVDFQAVDGAWVQQGIARVADAATRTTEYAKASAAYLVQGVKTYRVDWNVVEEYSAIYHASTNINGRDAAGWYPVSVDIVRSGWSTASVTNQADGTTLRTLTFKRRSYEQRIILVCHGSAVGVGGSGSAGFEFVASTGGTVTSNVAPGTGTTTSSSTVSGSAVVTIAAGTGTDVTITIRTNTTGVNHTFIAAVFWSLQIEGEY